MKIRIRNVLGAASSLAALLALMAYPVARAADTDIYGPSGASGGGSNVLFFLDNTANWSNATQAWLPGASWAKCSGLTDPTEIAQCKEAIEKVFYVGPKANEKRPWEPGFKEWKNSDAPTQGQIEVRALGFVLTKLVCDPDIDPITNKKKDPIDVNVGLLMLARAKDGGSVGGGGDPVAMIAHHVQALAGTPTSGTCKKLLDKLASIDAKITDPESKTSQDANYSAALYEAFKYFGGYTNPTLANSTGARGDPWARYGYGPGRWGQNATPNDDPDAFVDAARITYRSPLSTSGACGSNYLVVVGNTYPKAEKGDPVNFTGLNYTPPPLSASSSDTTRKADEWAYFLSNTDVHETPGIQPVLTYAVNVFLEKPDSDQQKLLRSMAAQGGVASGNSYIEVGGNLYELVKKLGDLLVEMAARDSVFSATSLPVSTTTQGTFLNQIFVGMFRPDRNFSPRWLGNLKQYELKLLSDGSLDLVGQNGQTAIGNDGFFNSSTQSFWTTSSVFFNNSPAGTPLSISDLPDGALVDKGGVAQRLRESNLQSSASRKVYTVPAAQSAATSLYDFPFEYTKVPDFSTDKTLIDWVRGQNNVATGDTANQPESFNGSYLDNTSIKELGASGARHSIHGDALHARPFAFAYGETIQDKLLGTDTNGNEIIRPSVSSDVAVFYGSNDGFFRSINGNKIGPTAGQELWSFIAPEHYEMIKRLRKGTPQLHLPENDEDGKLIAQPADAEPKGYAFDGPIGAYARYSATTTTTTTPKGNDLNKTVTVLDEAIVYPAMRRGGRTVYAIDVSKKHSDDTSYPKFLWKITGGSGDYAKLAQTWSTPKAIVVPGSTGAPNVVLIMGGGYDPQEDENLSGTIGNAIYIIDGRTGTKIREIPTDYSVPSDIALVDMDLDGFPDRGYVADVRGNLYRVDLPKKSDFLNPVKNDPRWSGVVAKKIAVLGGTEVVTLNGIDKTVTFGKIFFPPDVIVTREFVAVLVGSGDREKPLTKVSAEKFFVVKDTLGVASATATQVADMVCLAQVQKDINNPDATPTTDSCKASVPAGDLTKGCYVRLLEDGEKVINAPYSVAGVAYFGTNQPNTSRNACTGDLGKAYAYRLPLFCNADPLISTVAGGGLLPSPVGGVVLITGADGSIQKVPFLIGAGTGSNPFKPEKPAPAITPKRTKLYWRIDNRNR